MRCDVIWGLMGCISFFALGGFRDVSFGIRFRSHLFFMSMSSFFCLFVSVAVDFLCVSSFECELYLQIGDMPL